MSIDRALVDAALADVTDPNTGRPFAAAKNLKNVAVDGAHGQRRSGTRLSGQTPV